MKLLSRAQFQIFGVCIEVSLEVGYGILIRIVIVNTQAASYIDILYGLKALLLQTVLQFIYAV